MLRKGAKILSGSGCLTAGVRLKLVVRGSELVIKLIKLRSGRFPSCRVRKEGSLPWGGPAPHAQYRTSVQEPVHPHPHVGIWATRPSGLEGPYQDH